MRRSIRTGLRRAISPTRRCSGYGKRRRVPAFLLSLGIAVPVAIALPVTTPPGASAHPVAPKVSTWDATADLRASAGDAFAPRGSVTGSEHRTSGFSMVGVRWSPGGLPPDAEIQVRTRSGSGAWSDWTTAEADDTGPNNGSADARAAAAVNGTRVESEPIYVGKADSVQTRVVSASGAPVAPTSLDVVTIDPGISAADASVTSSGPADQAAAAAITPGIHSRAEWGADESLRSRNPGCGTPSYSDTVVAAIVHHTVNSNNYSAADVPSLIRGIYAYHVITEGYCDIAYNFIVDRFGQIWEGRYGGIANPVLGAHAGGFNTRTTGVAVLGTYTSTGASAQAINSLQVLLAWKLGLNYNNPASNTVLVSAGGPFTAYPEGTPVVVNVISGHRDVDQTSCPGQGLYNQLPAIRAGAANYLGEGFYGFGAATQPGSGNVPITFSAYSTRSAGWSITITDSAGHPIRQYTGAVGAGGQFAATWDGRTSSGARVPRDVYLATFQATAGADSALPRTIAFGVTYGAGDLTVASVPNSSGGTVSVGIAAQDAGYSSVAAQASTALSVSDPQNWRFEFASYDGDQQGDLYAIHERNTASGKVEVHVLSAKTNYQTYLAHIATALSAVDSGQWQFRIAPSDGDGAADLYAIRTVGGGFGTVEVHILSAASAYQSFSDHASTALPEVTDAQWTFLISGSGDLVGVLRYGGASGKVEVHTLSRASRYQAFSLHVPTPLPADTSGKYEFSSGDVDRDGVPDLAVALVNSTGSGKLEIHALGGAGFDQNWVLHSSSPFAQGDPDLTTAAVFG